MMIDRVHFENFKSLGDVTIDLAPLTVLVGANGCGKSSVLQGIQLLSTTGSVSMADGDHTLGRLAKVFGGVRRLASHRPDVVVLQMRLANGDELRLEVTVPAEPSGQMAFKVLAGRPAHSLTASVSAASPGAEVFADARIKQFGSVAYLHLDARVMAQTSVSDDEEPEMGFDGAGLASTLAWMKGANEDEVDQITADLATIVPGVKRIATQRPSVTRTRMERMIIDGQAVRRPIEETVRGDHFTIEFDSGEIVPADLLSEGTVLVLGLLTKLREPRRPKLFLLDDIDRGLHLTAQSRLVDELRRLMQLDPALQIICTTHSPYLLDRFAPEEIRVLALDEDRRTHVQALTAHPDFEKWRYGVQTGEMWASLGESWVTASEAPAS